MAKDNLEWYHIPKGEYSDRWLRCLAMAVHLKKINPSELSYWFNEGWSQDKMSKELYDRVKNG